MKFGPVPLSEAEGAILAHSLPVEGGRIRKGHVLGADEIARLAAAGHVCVTVARLESGDVHEDDAAARIAAAVVPAPEAAHLKLVAPHAGRVNILATANGVLEVDAARVHSMNAVDPAITLATAAPFARALPAAIVATVKIITFAVPGARLERAAEVVSGALRVRPVEMKTAALVISTLDGAPDEKGAKAVAQRLDALGMGCAVQTTRHVVEDIAGALARAAADRPDLFLVLTGSATSDPLDVAPQAVRAAGGTVTRFGIPVDPGNLLFLGELGGRPVIGLPGCVRSPALNGADWVLARVTCGLVPDNAELAAMGVGGLLKDSPARGMPRVPPKAGR